MNDPCNDPAGGGVAAALHDYLRFRVTVTWTNPKGKSRTMVSDTYRTPTYTEKAPYLVDTLAGSC
jgi:hypothetical protein